MQFLSLFRILETKENEIKGLREFPFLRNKKKVVVVSSLKCARQWILIRTTDKKKTREKGIKFIFMIDDIYQQI